jgi:hypothetical protein
VKVEELPQKIFYFPENGILTIYVCFRYIAVIETWRGQMNTKCEDRNEQTPAWIEELHKIAQAIEDERRFESWTTDPGIGD